MTDEDIDRIADHVWTTGASEIERLKESINKNAVADAVKTIAGCKGRIIVSGAGTSGAAAKKIAHSLSCIECPAFFLSPADAVHGALGSVQQGDVVILISKGGGTAEIVNMLPSIKKKQAVIIGVTEKPESYLGQSSDICLKVKINREADEFNMLATTSTMAVIAVFDAVCIALMEYTSYTREQFLVIHPGGAVGEKLLEENKS